MSRRACDPPGQVRVDGCWGQRAFVAGIVVLALLAASCAAEPEDAARPGPELTTPAPGPEPEATGPPEEDAAEPDPGEIPVPRELRFTAPRLGGGQLNGAEYAGRDVAIWFWAPW